MSKFRVVALVCAVVVVAGCSHDRVTASPPGPAASSPVTVAPSSVAPSSSASPSPSARPSGGGAPSGSVLPGGKGDFPLAAGVWRSPAGFAPTLRVTVPAGWTSVHRYADSFDIGRPDPAKDAPLVSIVFLTPRERTAAAALTDVSTRANGNVVPTPGKIGPVTADGVDITGGTGQLIASASGGVALDAADGQQVRLLTATVKGRPLVVAVLVPQSGQWDTVWPDVESVLATVTFG
jgi:hypothetical protein